jgi:hypothetical protein
MSIDRIDFTPLSSNAMTPVQFAEQFSFSDLRAAVHRYLDGIRDLVQQFNDEQLTFEPVDKAADDPFAASADEAHIAWSLAHLVLHVTASLEEGAAFSSLLARGVAIGGRVRYEPEWRTVTTRQQVLHRLEESRRMVMALLDSWPDEPHLDVYRIYDTNSRYANVKSNAPAALLSSLRHFDTHIDQFEDVANQIRARSANPIA